MGRVTKDSEKFWMRIMKCNQCSVARCVTAEWGSYRGKYVGPGEGTTTPYGERIGASGTVGRGNPGWKARAASTSIVSLPGGNGYLLGGLIGEVTVVVSER
jgi:hypothetical protein